MYAGLTALCAFVGVAVLYAGVPAHGFDLQGAPVLVKRPAADITDTYLFPSPIQGDIVAVMDVYPSLPAGAGATTSFDQGVLYTMKFDNNYASEAVNGGRPIENVVFQFSFGVAGTGQLVTAYGPAAPSQTGPTTKLIGATGSGFINKSFSFATTSGQVTVFAGARRDPAFWDVQQFWKIIPDRNQGSTAKTCLPAGTDTCPQGFNALGTDYFQNTNVLSIVVEMPKTLIAGSGRAVIAYWATTSTSNGQ
jgi:hypothetical protein